MIHNMDFKEGLKSVPDQSVDLVVMDPPYRMITTGGRHAIRGMEYQDGLTPIADGITNDDLDAIVRVMKRINVYVWCNKAQLRQYIDYFEDRGATTDLLTWHKTNPVPMCGNKYLSDTEYCLFFREPGVHVYGTMETKVKWYATPQNADDRDRWGHPTIKPLNIIRNLIVNSSRPGDLVLDPFLGSGTTAVACIQEGRDYLGYEINPEYYAIAEARIADAKRFKPVSLLDFMEGD